ncbi:MAG TPA: glycosyl hydrolase 115 family protein, partial [Chitinophagaceae bacterium]|nr:glycosyl hydrolase 115 family protein [Chitinophagaceae bacterium]
LKPHNYGPYTKRFRTITTKECGVPDDVTLLLCDDNWGNIRRLPKLSDKPRGGGYGIYYHFDYVGGPRNYKWVNTNPIPRVWEQMHLAWEHHVRQIWIVNVGDLKPMEFPISFFLDYAWAPDKIGVDDIAKYTENWAANQFGNKNAKEIADILSKYAKYNGRRKPELLDANTYSYDNYNEAIRVTKDYSDLLVKAEKINKSLPAEYKDAYFQLVLHPVKACANLQEMYTRVAINRQFATKKLITANEEAEKVKKLYLQDSLISLEYNSIAGGKWNHMMDQAHIGYTYWQQPPKQKMPELRYISPDSALPLTLSIDTMALFKNAALTVTTGPGNVFAEIDGYVSISAPHYSKAVNTEHIQWKILPDLGRTGSAISTFPVTAVRQSPIAGSPELQYQFYSNDTGVIKLHAYFSPTLNINNDEGLQYAVSIDNEKPQIISINKEDNNPRAWEKWIANNIIDKTTEHRLTGKGPHTIHYWMVDAAVVLQNIILDLGGLKPSYLGPPETMAEKTKLK